MDSHGMTINQDVEKKISFLGSQRAGDTAAPGLESLAQDVDTVKYDIGELKETGSLLESGCSKWSSASCCFFPACADLFQCSLKYLIRVNHSPRDFFSLQCSRNVKDILHGTKNDQSQVKRIVLACERDMEDFTAPQTCKTRLAYPLTVGLT